MPINVKEFNNEPIRLVEYIGNIAPDEANTVAENVLFPAFRKIAPTTMHVIYDVTELEWDFPDFINYLNSIRMNRQRGLVPPNSRQYVVGQTKFLESYRDWLYKQFGVQMGAFSDIESALKFIRHMIS